jgi:anti-anti-sigma regulatory factor
METDDRKQGEISFHGDLTVRQGQQLKATLLTTIGQHDTIVVRLTEDAEIDTAFLQLLCSAHRTAVVAGKCLSLDTSRSTHLHQQLEYVGFVRHIGCLLDCNNNCIWVADDRLCTTD